MEGLPSRRPSALPSQRPRCATHGLILAPDGSCVRCLRAQDKSNTVRVLSVLAAAVLVVAGTLGAYRAFALVRVARATVEPSPAAAAASDTASASSVIMYSTGSCPHCRKAKAWLDAHGVAYTERRVDSDEEARAELAKLRGGIGVPTFVIEGDVLRGFEPTGHVLDEALRRHGLR